MTTRNRRAFLGTAVVASVVIVAAVGFLTRGNEDGPDAHLQGLARQHARLERARRYLPSWLADRLEVGRRLGNTWNQQQTEIEALVKSGQLVKVPIPVSGLGDQSVVMIHQQLQRDLKDAEGYWIAMFYRQSNTVVVICRPDQALQYRSAFDEIRHRISSAEHDVPASGSQPIRSETNSTSSGAGSRR